MPFRVIIGEVILRPIIEGLSYFSGYIILKVITIGAIRLAPLPTIHQKNPDKKKWYQIDWNLCLHRPGKKSALRAEFTCMIGMIAWGLVGLGIYLEHRGKEVADEASLAVAMALSATCYLLTDLA